jgi:hypothetical protein
MKDERIELKRNKFHLIRHQKQHMAVESLLPLGHVADAVGDFMDAEENRWWVRPLKALIYIAVFSIVPVYFYFV